MRTRALLFVLLAGCGSKPSAPPPPDPPVVQVLPHSSPTVDTSFAVDVNVTGCDSVASLVLNDGQMLLAQSTNPPAHSTFTIQSNQVNYKVDGIAAALALTAKATCANGTSSTSNAVGELFLPAAQVFSGTFPITSLFLEPDGSGLITCANVNGAVSVARVSTDGTVTSTSGTGLGFNCTQNGYVVRGGANEIYWVEPGMGVARLNANLQVMGTPSLFGVAGAYVAPANVCSNVADCPAVFFDSSNANMLWVDRTTGNAIVTVAMAGVLDGEPGFGQLGLVIPEEQTEQSGTTVDLQVERFNIQAQQAFGPPLVLGTIQLDQLGAANIPGVNVSPDGADGYFISGANFDEAYACDISNANPCTDRSTGGGLLFHVTIPGGPFSIVQPVGNFVVVAGSQSAQFTNLSGTPVGNPVTPTGALRVLGIYPGKPDEFYVLDGDSQGNAQEVVMIETPGSEAARFTVDTGAIAVDLDQNETPYLLQGGKLAKLLTPHDYFVARQ